MAIDYRTEPEYIEYLDGEPHPKVSPRLWHGIVQGAFASLLRVRGRGVGLAATEWDCWLPDRERLTKFIPDVSFVPFARLRPLSDHDRQFPPFAPDVAIEIFSPGDSSSYLEKKIRLYLAYGTQIVFDVDPAARTVPAITANEERIFHAGDHFASDAVPWLAFDVGELFADLDIPEQ